jgi:hypothetical protein
VTVNERYELIGGDASEIWIVDRHHPERPAPLFRLQSHDERFARKFLAALNASNSDRLRLQSRGLTPLQRLLGEVRRVCDLADEDLNARERHEFLAIVTTLVARLNAESVQEPTR